MIREELIADILSFEIISKDFRSFKCLTSHFINGIYYTKKIQLENYKLSFYYLFFKSLFYYDF